MMTKWDLRPYLDDLEERIDDAEETALFEAWRTFAHGEHAGEELFAPTRSKHRPPAVEWPRIWVNDALVDLDAMILQQLGSASALLASGSGRLMAARANYGSSIMATLFGAASFVMERDLDTLPTSFPVPERDLRRAIDAGVPDLRTGQGALVLDGGAYFKEKLAGYPKIMRHVHVYHPDTQGPIDVVELIRGPSLFEEAYSDPEFVHALLSLVTSTYIAFLREWAAIWPFRADGVEVHWGLMHRGAVMLREDSAMNFSGAMFDEFMRPYDQRVLDEFGGGAIHFCGHGDHFIDRAASMSGLHAINMSQPHLNDMEKIYRATIDRGIVLIDFPDQAARAALDAGRALHGRVHVERRLP